MSDSPTIRIFQLAQIARTISVGLVLICAKYVPSFDASASLAVGQAVNGTSADLAVLRWDAIHFLAIARDGYTHEQQLAFQPLWPWIMRILSIPFAALRTYPTAWRLSREQGTSMDWGLDVEVRDTVMAGTIGAMGAFVLAAIMFYRLTRLYYPSKVAYRTAMLYCLAPTPAVLSSPYTEPLYALATFTGLYLLLTRKALLGAVCLAAATGTRATGVFMAPVAAAFILQSHDLRSFTRRATKAAFVSGMIVSPFLAFQAYGYFAFCLPQGRRPWCGTGTLPYSFVQAKYWNVGFLQYWTMEQIPNILLALPVLYVSLRGTLTYFLRPPRKHLSKLNPAVQPRKGAPPIWPLQAHSLLMTLILLFSSHTQIALRVISGDPTFWWNLASLSFRPCPNHPPTSVPAPVGEEEQWISVSQDDSGANNADRAGAKRHEAGPGCVKMTRTGKVWVFWAMIWGAFSIVLWAGHYPPA